MYNVTVTEKDMIATIVSVLESENEITLANVINISKFVYSPQWAYSDIVPNQKKLYGSLKVPLHFKMLVEKNLEMLSRICKSIYNNDDTYYFFGLTNIDILPDEILLKGLYDAYSLFLKNNATQQEHLDFESKVINAKAAYSRLDEFLKRAVPRQKLFKELGFGNVSLNFNFLDVIRQTRNDSAHPTVNTITESQFKIMLSNYQSFIHTTINAINNLPSLNY